MPTHTHEVEEHSHGATDSGHNHINGSYDRLLKNTKPGDAVTAPGKDKNNSGTEPNILKSAEIKTGHANITIDATVAILIPTGGDQPHENRPPYIVLAYIIKL